MTVDEIFSAISAHQIKGLMFHAQMADYYTFLGLCDYANCHEEHYYAENKAWRKLCMHYTKHCNKLIREVQIESPNAIPESWYDYSRSDVDANTKRKAVKSGLEKWLAWETETKQLYENMFSELFSLNEIALAMFLKKYIKDVDDELACVMQYKLNKDSIDYNISDIIAEQ